MAPPIVDTFEHDIADEIRQKEASITDIAGATGEIGNNKKEMETSNSGVLIGIVLALVLCAIIGIMTMGYLYYTGKYDPFAPLPAQPQDPKKDTSKVTSSLSSLFPSLQDAFGIYVTNLEKSPIGYTITISAYSPVFSYMIKNESTYKDEIGMNVNSKQKIKATSAPIVATGGLLSGATSTNATSTTGTSSQVVASTTVDETPVNPGGDNFYDVTVDNQNMRVGTSLFGTVVYAFIGNDHLVFSSSTGGILLLRNTILHK